MSLSRRDLLSASAVLLAGPGAALRAAGKEAAPGDQPLVLCWNENPYGPSPAARLAVSRAIAQGCRYPADAEMQELVEALATHEGVGADCIVTGTGSGELLCALGLLCGRDGGEIIAAEPTYAELPDRLITIVDEAYMDFTVGAEVASVADLVATSHRVVVLRTFSKIHGMAGLRCGYAIARPDMAATLAAACMSTPNILTVHAARASLGDHAFLADC